MHILKRGNGQPLASRQWWLAVGIALLGLTCLPRPAWSVEGVEQLTAKVVRMLTDEGSAAPRAVLLSPSDCYDAETQASLPLAVHLRDALGYALRESGLHLVEPRSHLTDVWVLQCQWKHVGQRLSVTLVATPWSGRKRGTIKIVSAWLPMTPELADLLQPDFTSYGHTLIHRLALDDRQVAPRLINLRPLQVSSTIGGRRSNDFFDTWLRNAVGGSNLLIPVQTEAALAHLDRPTLRTRGVRPRPKPGMSLTGDLVAAQGELSGHVALQEQNVQVAGMLQDAGGQSIAQASVVIPLDALPPEVVSDLSGHDAPVIQAEAPISRQGLSMDLTATRGEGKASYRIGEQIAFLARLNQDAYVYLFDLDSNGKATLLYPAFGVEATPLPAGQPLLMPDDGLPYTLEVTEPPGRELIWAVASTVPLDIPRELDGDWAETTTLMPRVRGLVTPEAPYAEAQLLIETNP